MSQSHTPLPWKAETEFSCRIMAHNIPKGPMTICDIRGWGYLTGKGHGALGLSQEEAIAIQKANAELIVRAVNAHEDLIGALKKYATAELERFDYGGILKTVGYECQICGADWTIAEHPAHKSDCILYKAALAKAGAA